MRWFSRSLALGVVALAAGCGLAAVAQSALIGADVETTRKALAQARAQGEVARKRAEILERQAQRVSLRAERTARDSAAVAARIQETEAEIAESEAKVRLVTAQRQALVERLAEKREPLMRLTAALQRLSRRPPVLALLRPGSVRDTMHMRALFDSMLPQVESRTVDLRREIARGRALETKARQANAGLQESRRKLAARRQRLLTIETRQRLASREAEGVASRESERALALAEKARDLGGLVTELGKQGELRAELAALPGPILRPGRPQDSQVTQTESASAQDASLETYILPMQGRIVAGFGDAIEGRPRSRGLVLAVRGGAQAVAPAPGRVAFAGPYRGYGRIVIIEHDGGWTSLVTGLARLDTRVGQDLVAGSPLGVTPPGDPIVTLELRRAGEPVNPLRFLGAL